jgi:hypothetical protein
MGKVKQALKHRRPEERLGIETFTISEALKEEKKMNVKEIRAGRLSVTDGGKEIAQVGVQDGKVRSIAMASKDADKDEVTKVVNEFLAKAPKAEKGPVKKKKTTTKKKKTEKVEVPKTKKAPAKKKKATPPAGPELKKLIKKVGVGKCLCGCGAEVTRMFKPGHDMRLKSALKKAGKAKSMALAKELGWDKIIKWAD